MHVDEGKRGSTLSAGKIILVTIITAVIALYIINLIVAFEQNIENKGLVRNGLQNNGDSTDFGIERYKNIRKTSSDINVGNLILVNNNTPYKFPKKSDVISVYAEKNHSYKVSDKSIALNPNIISHFNEMMNDFEKARSIHDIIVVSGYRTIADQKEILDEKIKEFGKAEAVKQATQPGFSEHHTGYALDIGIYKDNGQSQRYIGTGKYGWINENCTDYGFILRYSGEKAEITGITDEPWHYRYVGVPHAAIIKNNDFCLEEYLDYLKNYSFGAKHLKYTGKDGIKYEIYYVKASKDITSVPVPLNREYNISGNNTDGFIVTVKLS